VSIIIESPEHFHGQGVSGGNIVDAAAAPDWTDELALSLTLLVEFPRQAVYDTVWVENEGGAGVAVIAARGVDSDDPTISVETRYSLAPDEHYITIETALSTTGGDVLDYVAGDAVYWGSSEHLAPLYGFDIVGVTTISEWLGGAGTVTSYAYTMAGGNVSATHGNSWSDPLVLWATIPGGGSVSYTRYLVIGAGGLSSASDIVHEIRGSSIGTVTGSVLDIDTGAPVEGASLDCLIDGYALYTRILGVSDGTYSATLPPESFYFDIAAPDYYPDIVFAEIVPSETTEIDLELEARPVPPAQGDTLTVVMRPILSIPTIVEGGDNFTLEARAPDSPLTWAASLTRDGTAYPLTVGSAAFDAGYDRWYLDVTVPADTPEEMYDLVVTATGGIADTVAHSVMVESSIEDDFYFVHITDTHLPGHRYYDDPEAASDTTEMNDLRAVIQDVNLINPAFVLITGDVINEGELEDLDGRRVFTLTQRLMREFDVPVYLVTGNHDVGGWDDTPAPQGSARRNWWKFFGWQHLYDPPPADPLYTQNYSFDYGQAHFVGLDAYINYDAWRFEIYGWTSFTSAQLDWLDDDLALADPAAAKILFYHFDFEEQVDLGDLGVDGALWGHTHQNLGSETEHPFNLCTAAVADENRWMRLVRVSGSTVTPSEPVNAGEDGEMLTIEFDSPNDGSTISSTATITNLHDETFEHGLVTFQLRAHGAPYVVSAGEVVQTLIDGTTATCYVAVPIAADSVTTITIEPSTEVPESPAGVIVLLRQSHPNPARAGAALEFVLAYPTDVRLEVTDLAGRHVTTLMDERATAGPNTASWNLRDDAGHRVASGVYFYHLTADGQSATKKLVVTR